tara:strand:- start:992 stop:1372 length:381 start_codon:yes stop_codon:yes gene_type:complete
MKKTFLSTQAREFRTKYNLKSSADKSTRSYQTRLIVEEFKEFLEAEGMLFRHGRNVKEECLKELADLVYVCYQYAENMGWFLDEALDRVHLSNMSKLDEEGKPIYREDGKVLKGPNYKPPTLEDLF